jgi:hypothetical protein
MGEIWPEEGRAGPGTRVSRRTALAGVMAALAAPGTMARGWAQQRRESGGGGGLHVEPMRRGPLYVSAGLARYQHTATPLLNGCVLVAGGFHVSPRAGSAVSNLPQASVQIYDPRQDAWFAAAPLQTPRARHAAVLLLDGRVLVLGGYSLNVLATAEVYDPRTDIWSHAPPLATPRFDHAATLVRGQVIVTGGIYGHPLSSVETYTL